MGFAYPDTVRFAWNGLSKALYLADSFYRENVIVNDGVLDAELGEQYTNMVRDVEAKYGYLWLAYNMAYRTEADESPMLAREFAEVTEAVKQYAPELVAFHESHCKTCADKCDCSFHADGEVYECVYYQTRVIV